MPFPLCLLLSSSLPLSSCWELPRCSNFSCTILTRAVWHQPRLGCKALLNEQSRRQMEIPFGVVVSSGTRTSHGAHFHGNAGALIDRAGRLRRFQDAGIGVFMMAYRGYGGSTGKPTERDNVADGRRAFDALMGEGVDASEIFIFEGR